MPRKIVKEKSLEYQTAVITKDLEGKGPTAIAEEMEAEGLPVHRKTVENWLKDEGFGTATARLREMILAQNAGQVTLNMRNMLLAKDDFTKDHQSKATLEFIKGTGIFADVKYIHSRVEVFDYKDEKLKKLMADYIGCPANNDKS